MTDLLAGPGTPEIPLVEASRPDPHAIQRVRRIRKAVLLVAILGVIGLSLATTPALSGAAVHGVIIGAGVIALVVAIVGRAWCSLYIGGRKKSEIVDRGPYSVSRNPLYVGSVVMALGFLMIARHPVAVAAGLLYLAVFYPVIIREEAKFLRGRFQDAYHDWALEVPIFFPRLRPAGPRASKFEFARVLANHEWRTVLGLVLLGALMAWRVR